MSTNVSQLLLSKHGIATATYDGAGPMFDFLHLNPYGGAATPTVTANAYGLDDSDVMNDIFVESTWRARAVRYDREQQCEPIVTKDAISQSRTLATRSVQTSSSSTGTSTSLAADAALPASFPAFLQRTYPLIMATLDANADSSAFDEYLVAWGDERDPYTNVFALTHEPALNDMNNAKAELAASLVAKYAAGGGGGGKSKNNNKKVQNSQPAAAREDECSAVLALSWSCNGSVLVASYGSSSHTGWCNHSSCATLAFWNVHRRQLNPAKADFALEQDCCTMALAFHPERPNILAGGMFNGEVRIWDTSLVEEDGASGGVGAAAEANVDASIDPSSSTAPSASASTASSSASERNPCLMRSRIDDHFHREPISSLSWSRDSLRNWQLVSVSTDGKILFWPADDAENKLRSPSEGIILQASEKYAGQQSQGGGSGNAAGSGRKRDGVIGGTAIAFVQPSASGLDSSSSASSAAGASATTGTVSGQSTFLAATEGGGILKLSLNLIPKRKGYIKSGEHRWNRDAYRLVEGADPRTKFELKKSVEKYAKSLVGSGAVGSSSGSADQPIELDTVFASRPLPSSLYPNTIVMSYEGHTGPCYGLCYNRFDRNIFASASTDGRLKVFHVDRPKPILSVEPPSLIGAAGGGGAAYLYACVWSPSRPLVLAVSDSEGRIFVYDLLASMLAPALTILANPDRSSIQSLAWNAAEPSLIASADMKGRINVWNMSAKYTMLQPGEKRLLEQMAKMK